MRDPRRLDELLARQVLDWHRQALHVPDMPGSRGAARVRAEIAALMAEEQNDADGQR